MSLPLAALLAGLVAVALVHTRSRLLGSIGAVTWCVGAGVFAALEFQERDTLVFLGIATKPWVFYAFILSLFIFNCAVIVRMVRLQIAGTAANEAADKAPR